MSRSFRRASYDGQLRWARGVGLNPSTGFRGLSDELGPNPELAWLDAALMARMEALLPPADGDPFAEDLPALMAV